MVVEVVRTHRANELRPCRWLQQQELGVAAIPLKLLNDACDVVGNVLDMRANEKTGGRDGSWAGFLLICETTVVDVLTIDKTYKVTRFISI